MLRRMIRSMIGPAAAAVFSATLLVSGAALDAPVCA